MVPHQHVIPAAADALDADGGRAGDADPAAVRGVVEAVVELASACGG